MAIPDFFDGYHLPPGEHVCTLDEIKERFGIINSNRQKVWDDFAALLERLERLKIMPTIILVDGSFVTGRELPEDVDFACLIPPGRIKKALKEANFSDREAIKMICNPNSQGNLRVLFGAHPLIVDNEKGLYYWSTFLRRGGPNGLKEPDYKKDPDWVIKPKEKGILKIVFKERS